MIRRQSLDDAVTFGDAQDPRMALGIIAEPRAGNFQRKSGPKIEAHRTIVVRTSKRRQAN